METKDTALLLKLRGLFGIEAEEHLQAIIATLLTLEKGAAGEEESRLLETLFREVHTLKGAARAVNLGEIETICQAVESVCAGLKRREWRVWPELFDTLHRAMDVVRQLSALSEGAGEVPVAEMVEAVSRLEAQGRAQKEGATPEMDTLASQGLAASAVSQADAPTGEGEAQAQVGVEQTSPESQSVKIVEAETEGSVIQQQQESAAEEMPASPEAKKTRRRHSSVGPENTTPRRPRTPKKKVARAEAEGIKPAGESATSVPRGKATPPGVLADTPPQLYSRDDEFVPREESSLAPRAALLSVDEDHPQRSESPNAALTCSSPTSEVQPFLTIPETRAAEPGVAYQQAQETVQPETSAAVGTTEIRKEDAAIPSVMKVVSLPTEQDAAPLPRVLKNRVGRSKTQTQNKPAVPTETVRIATTKLDSLFLQAEEMLAVKLKTGQHTAELREIVALLEMWKREWAKIHTDIRKAQRILEKEENRGTREPIYLQAAKLVEFLDWTHHHLKGLARTLSGLTRTVTQDQQVLSSMVDILLEDAKKVLMLPFASTLEILPKMVRDISRAQGKEVELVIQGAEVEIDKRILEEMKDPLIHLLRNCIDHGIEPQEERKQQHKPSRGTIAVTVAPGDGNSVDVVVSDDGAGIDTAKVKAAAVRCGVLTQQAAEKLSDQEAIALIFQSDVSTSPVVTALSGRGLGMAIVREKVEKLGGQIAVETTCERGTTFRIRLPLTLATFRGILVQTAGQMFVVPTANVERVVRLKCDEIHTVGNRETVTLAGRTLVLQRLDHVLGLPRKARNDSNARFLPALVLGGADQQFVFALDAVVNEQEVLFKSLGKQLAKVRNIAGATVLGSGQVVPVLNVADLITSAGGSTQIHTKVAPEVEDEAPAKKSVLVAEDSITSRMLLKEILEAAGYVVSTAIDGEDAFAALQRTKIDLVVSDIEMPRLNGFALTAKIRADEKHTHIPVVLVTGLESQEDRERGIDAGANAYVVKGSFDQSNLLETIRRLI